MRLRRRLWNPYLLVFLSSACIMTIELVASRMIAPRLGRSIYTWTSVIAVILAGISLGNYLGGRLSDRHGSFPVLGAIFSLAALATLSVLWLNNDLHDVTLPVKVPFVVWVLLYVAGVYLLPSVILGCVSPMVVKLAVTDLKSSGTTVGRIYASSSVGSIVGTFATGFFLVGPAFCWLWAFGS
jgi:MFS family permease